MFNRWAVFTTTLYAAVLRRLQQASSWARRREEKERRMQAVIRRMSRHVPPTDKTVEPLEALVSVGDRIVLEGHNHKQAKRRSVIAAVYKYCWRVWLGGLLLSTTCFAQSWGSVGVGYNYLLTEGTTSHWTSSHGWYVLSTFNINKQVGVFADATNFYTKGQNIHGETFGSFHAISNETRYTPFVFLGIGHLRASQAGAITNSFDWAAGGGLTVRLTRWISFQSIPVEYVMNTAKGNIGTNFVARAGLAFTIPK